MTVTLKKLHIKCWWNWHLPGGDRYSINNSLSLVVGSNPCLTKNMKKSMSCKISRKLRHLNVALPHQISLEKIWQQTTKSYLKWGLATDLLIRYISFQHRSATAKKLGLSMMWLNCVSTPLISGKFIWFLYI